MVLIKDAHMWTILAKLYAVLLNKAFHRVPTSYKSADFAKGVVIRLIRGSLCRFRSSSCIGQS